MKELIFSRRVGLIFMVLIFMATLFLFPHESASAAIKQCAGNTDNNICAASDKSLIGDLMGNVINLMLYLAGAIAVVMIVIGGIRYITSDGDPGAAGKAKNTIIYALVGLVIAVMSFAIVNFVLGKV